MAGDEKKLITPLGFQKLQQEYKQLKSKERPEVVDVVAWAASNGDRSENADYHYGKKRLREIDKRLDFLNALLESVEVVDPAQITSDKIGFGATVTILEEDDTEKKYALVGADESDPDTGKINWRSPLARALLNAMVGDFVTVRSPKGERDVEIVAIEYQTIA